MKAFLLPLQSLYKSTQVLIDDKGDDRQVIIDIKSEDYDNNDPSIREIQKWGYSSMEEVLGDDMLMDIKLSGNYERQVDYEFAIKIISKINGEII